MTITLKDATEMLAKLKDKDLADGRDPLSWWTYENHVLGAALVAKTIASKIKGMDKNKAYISALLHDICRTHEARLKRFHGILGYEKLINLDAEVARQSLLHMFPLNEIPPYEECKSLFFNKKQDYDFVLNFVNNTQLTPMDMLIQLSDSLANKYGFVTLEDRAKELSERKGITIPQEMMLPRYKLKAYFDEKVGVDIYTLFTGK